MAIQIFRNFGSLTRASEIPKKRAVPKKWIRKPGSWWNEVRVPRLWFKKIVWVNFTLPRTCSEVDTSPYRKGSGRKLFEFEIQMNRRKHQEIFLFWGLEFRKGYKVVMHGPMRPLSRTALCMRGIKRKKKLGHGVAVQPPGTTRDADRPFNTVFHSGVHGMLR